MAAQYSLTVLDRSGSPKRGATVELTVDRIHWKKAQTDSSGRATIPLEAAMTVIEVRVDGRQIRTMVAVAGSKEDSVKL